MRPAILDFLVFWSAPVLLSKYYFAVEDADALAAAEHGRLGVWPRSPLFSGMDAASTAGGGCIRAVLHLDR